MISKPVSASAARIEVLDSRLHRVLPDEACLEHLATGCQWTEGGVWMHEDDSVLFSDIPNNRMLRWSDADGMTVWRANAEYTNGHTREADGSLLHCSHGLRAIVRTRFNEKLEVTGDEVVVDRYQGRRFNSPNDVIVKSDGTIWFTDPPYGIMSDREGRAARSELGDNYVFRFDPASGALDIVTDFVEEPNGLTFSLDERILYVADTSAAFRTDGSGHHHIVAFDVLAGRSLANPRIFAVIEPGVADGFRIDRQGWIYTSSGDGIQVFHPDGSLLGKIFVPEVVANLSFGGSERDQLYICATTSLYRIRLNTQGVQRP